MTQHTPAKMQCDIADAGKGIRRTFRCPICGRERSGLTRRVPADVAARYCDGVSVSRKRQEAVTA
jgi:hypothetical protein